MEITKYDLFAAFGIVRDRPALISIVIDGEDPVSQTRRVDDYLDALEFMAKALNQVLEEKRG